MWIDEECWKKLEAMEGDSVSAKVRRCIVAADVGDDARVEALKRQITVLENKLAKQPRRMNSA